MCCASVTCIVSRNKRNGAASLQDSRMESLQVLDVGVKFITGTLVMLQRTNGHAGFQPTLSSLEYGWELVT